MVRLFLSFFVTVVVARWIYAETKLIVPEVVPVIDFTLDTVQIPTHDKWDKEQIASVMNEITNAAGSLVQVQPAQAAELDVLRSYGRPVYGSMRSSYGNMCASGGCETF